MPIIDLLLQESVGAYPSDMDWQALRQQQYAWIDVAKESNLPNMVNKDKLKNSWGLPGTKIPVMGKNKPTIQDGGMGCDFGDLEARAQYVSVTFVEKFFNLDMIPAETDQSQLTYAQVFAQKMRDLEEAAADYLETAVHNIVDTNKATAYNSGFVGATKRYPLASDALQVGNAFSNRFFNDLQAIMFADDFAGKDITVIGDAQLPAEVSYYEQQGRGNTANLSYQFSPYDFRASRSTVTSGGANVLATGFAVPANTIGYVSRIDGDSLRREASTTGIQWDTFKSDFLGIDMMIKYKSDCADVTARTLNPLDLGRFKEQWKIGFSVAIFTVWDDSQLNTGIKKFDILSV